VATAGFNQQQDACNEITISLHADWCHVKFCAATRHAERARGGHVRAHPSRANVHLLKSRTRKDIHKHAHGKHQFSISKIQTHGYKRPHSFRLAKCTHLDSNRHEKKTRGENNTESFWKRFKAGEKRVRLWCIFCIKVHVNV